ncbi:hypothetical protein [Deinococcus petrolearius]|uniref:Uncharacterized protein n=1 Tax=Deinococcus petrolearius TaxID=1751295 RepID=A0ABW1DJK9_9DEIO
MKDKIRRILDLVRGGKLSLEDASPLLAALSPRLALSAGDRELIASLLGRPELDSAQVAEHLLLLRGVREVPPTPPRAPQAPPPFGDPFAARLDSLMGRVTRQVEQAVTERLGAAGREKVPEDRPRLLVIEVESAGGDEYSANLPVSLAPHLDKLIPPHGREALAGAGLSVEALQLLVEAGPPPGQLISAEDSSGNSVQISIK